jgi:hypothetical protein
VSLAATLNREWAAVRLWTSNSQREDDLQGWLQEYKPHRYHSAAKGAPINPFNGVTDCHVWSWRDSSTNVTRVHRSGLWTSAFPITDHVCCSLVCPCPHGSTPWWIL